MNNVHMQTLYIIWDRHGASPLWVKKTG